MNLFDNSIETQALPHHTWRRLIWAGAILVATAMVIGLVSLAFFAFSIWQFVSDEMVAREVVPATFPVQISKAGRYHVFYEHRSVVNGRHFRTSTQPPALSLHLTDSAGRNVALEPSRMQYTYESPSRRGKSWFEFEVPAAGTYELEVTGSDGQHYVVAVGQPRLGMFFAGMASFVCGGGMTLLMLMLGSVLLIVGFVKRSRAYRKILTTPTHH